TLNNLKIVFLSAWRVPLKWRKTTVKSAIRALLGMRKRMTRHGIAPRQIWIGPSLLSRGKTQKNSTSVLMRIFPHRAPQMTFVRAHLARYEAWAGGLVGSKTRKMLCRLRVIRTKGLLDSCPR